jgi:ribosomal protein S18 acetylase RimI-like enzyme
LIRKRIPHQDDKVILGLVQTLLVPFARITRPETRLDLGSLRKRLKRCDSFVALSAGRQPCGFISLRPEPRGMFVDMLAVHPQSQSKGWGSRLLLHAERSALRAGKREIYIWVDDTNRQAQSFYVAKSYEPFHYDKDIRCYLLRKLLQ